jgi:hypothetical protein
MKLKTFLNACGENVLVQTTLPKRILAFYTARFYTTANAVTTGYPGY